MPTCISSRDGFTLVELVIVVAVVTLLAGITIPLVADRVEDARIARAEAEMKDIAGAFAAHRADNGFWPERNSSRTIRNATHNFDYYRGLYRKMSTTWKNWDGPYLNEGVQVGSYMHAAYNGDGMVDPWGNYYRVYQYAKTSTFAGALVLVSGGPDGKISTNSASALRNDARGDDIIHVITRKL